LLEKGILNYQVRPSVRKEFMNLESDSLTKITLKDLTLCLIRCDIDQTRYYDEKLEKRDSRHNKQAIVAALFGIYHTEHRIFVDEKEKDENVKKDSGKEKRKQYPTYSEKGKEDS